MSPFTTSLAMMAGLPSNLTREPWILTLSFGSIFSSWFSIAVKCNYRWGHLWQFASLAEPLGAAKKVLGPQGRMQRWVLGRIVRPDLFGFWSECVLCGKAQEHPLIFSGHSPPDNGPVVPCGTTEPTSLSLKTSLGGLPPR